VRIRRWADLFRKDRVGGDPTRGGERQPGLFVEKEVRDGVAVQVPDLLFSEAEAPFAATAGGCGNAGPGGHQRRDVIVNRRGLGHLSISLATTLQTQANLRSRPILQILGREGLALETSRGPEVSGPRAG